MLTLRGIVICITLISLQLNAQAQATNLDQRPKVSPLLQSRLSSSAAQKIGVVLVSDKLNLTKLVDQKEILASFQRNNKLHLFCLLSKNQILTLAERPEIDFIELIRKPHVEFKQEGLDLTLNGVRFLQHNYPDLTGTEMNLSIKENLFDTIDIDFKNRIVALELASSHIDMHATNMASIAAGGGNSSPTAKGVAWDANISSSDFSNLFPDPQEYFTEHNILVQNHAYGTGIESYYGAETSAYDELTYTLPSLVHVFSAGNAGDQSPAEGKYEGLTGWANLTGQFKHSKNTITVGATDSLNQIVLLSSRGPAFDGRIKPEVVAYGHGGSSGSAAIVSGVSILIQQAFRNKFGYLPPSSLVKAALINTTTDIDNPGPDFKSGFGAVNADRAVTAIIDDRFSNVWVQDNDVIQIPLSIPNGAASVSISIAWIEPPSTILTQKAVRHDIDLELENISTGEIWLPWILNAAANSDSLTLQAKRGVDTTNNIEKITLSNPDTGEYVIRIRTDNVVTIEELVSVVWEIIGQDKFEWTFPTRDDHLLPASKNIIRWHTTTQETGTLSYRSIGDDWKVLFENVNPSTNYFIWNTPTDHGLAQLRWSSASLEVLSDTFVISIPPEPTVALLCTDSLIINWTDPGQSDSFEIFKLGERHLEHHQFVQDTFFIEYDPDPQNPYYAVALWFGDLQGPLSYAFDFTKQGGGCFIDAFYFLHVLNDKASFGSRFSLTEEIDSVLFEEKINGVYMPIQSLGDVDSTTLFFTSNLLKQGINDFRLRIILNDGREIISQEERVYFNKNNAVLLFPNPVRAGEGLSLLIKDIDEFDILILDIQGKVIFRFNDLESPVVLPPLNLIPGIYIYKIASSQGDLYGKMLVY